MYEPGTEVPGYRPSLRDFPNSGARDFVV
jgi:hypothetical protein